MAKVIENKQLKERKQNLKVLQILIEQYILHDKERIIKKVKKEQ